MAKPVMSRLWGMPSPDTFSCRPIGEFVRKYAQGVVVDPLARNHSYGLATAYTNDLNTSTAAQYHMDAEDFCRKLHADGVVADVGIFDPPYSPRQISECYKAAGINVGMAATQNARLYKRIRDALDLLMPIGGIVLSFGWNSAGMGKGRGYDQVEILLVAHGGAHNDTICLAERKR